MTTADNTDMRMMRRAIALATESVATGSGPFGAVIVKDGVVLAEASNRVVPDHDPTAHAEVNCIRQACHRLGTHDLEGCTIYTSCEPCPMCLGAIYWAHIGRIFYACTRKDAAEAGFADDHIYEELEKPLPERDTPILPLLRDEGLTVFRQWSEKSDRTEY